MWRLCEVGQLTLRQFAFVFNTLMSMTFFVIAPCFKVSFALIFNYDVRVCADEFREEFLLFLYNSSIDFCACR